MRIDIGEITLNIDDETGLVDVLFKGEKRLAGVDFGLYYGGEWWGFTAGNVKFEGIETIEGIDDYGRYKEIACLYSFSTKDEETVKVKKITKVYETKSAIHFRIENSCSKPKFSDATGAIGILDLPNFEAGVCSHNGHADPEIGEELLKSLESVEKETRELIESLGAEQAAAKLEPELDYDCWAYPFFLKDWREMPRFGVFLLVRYSDDAFAALVPVNGYGQKSYIRGGKFLESNVSIKLWSGGYDNTKVYDTIPAGLICFGEDPYESIKEAYQCALIAMGRPTVHRTEKPYPKIFEYLG